MLRAIGADDDDVAVTKRDAEQADDAGRDFVVTVGAHGDYKKSYRRTHDEGNPGTHSASSDAGDTDHVPHTEDMLSAFFGSADARSPDHPHAAAVGPYDVIAQYAADGEWRVTGEEDANHSTFGGDASPIYLVELHWHKHGKSYAWYGALCDSGHPLVKQADRSRNFGEKQRMRQWLVRQHASKYRGTALCALGKYMLANKRELSHASDTRAPRRRDSGHSADGKGAYARTTVLMSSEEEEESDEDTESDSASSPSDDSDYSGMLPRQRLSAYRRPPASAYSWGACERSPDRASVEGDIEAPHPDGVADNEDVHSRSPTIDEFAFDDPLNAYGMLTSMGRTIKRALGADIALDGEDAKIREELMRAARAQFGISREAAAEWVDARVLRPKWTAVSRTLVTTICHRDIFINQ